MWFSKKPKASLEAMHVRIPCGLNSRFWAQSQYQKLFELVKYEAFRIQFKHTDTKSDFGLVDVTRRNGEKRGFVMPEEDYVRLIENATKVDKFIVRVEDGFYKIRENSSDVLHRTRGTDYELCEFVMLVKNRVFKIEADTELDELFGACVNTHVRVYTNSTEYKTFRINSEVFTEFVRKHCDKVITTKEFEMNLESGHYKGHIPFSLDFDGGRPFHVHVHDGHMTITNYAMKKFVIPYTDSSKWTRVSSQEYTKAAQDVYVIESYSPVSEAVNKHPGLADFVRMRPFMISREGTKQFVVENYMGQIGKFEAQKETADIISRGTYGTEVCKNFRESFAARRHAGQFRGSRAMFQSALYEINVQVPPTGEMRMKSIKSRFDVQGRVVVNETLTSERERIELIRKLEGIRIQ
ncbi:MAG: hypothetical protein [Caudoviricetes sp.]|nr:MAG: hypothetical protein [Caudoviricetes sp.]